MNWPEALVYMTLIVAVSIASVRIVRIMKEYEDE